MRSNDVSDGISRRTVVRAGANLAWMVPAIAIVTEAPALAVSGQALQVSGTGSWAIGLLGADVTPWTANITVKNLSSTTAATGVTVVVDFTGNTGGLVSSFSSVNSNSGSWSVSPASGSAFTFTFSGSIPANGTASFSPSFGTLIALSLGGAHETAGLTANGSGFTTGTGSITSSN